MKKSGLFLFEYIRVLLILLLCLAGLFFLETTILSTIPSYEPSIITNALLLGANLLLILIWYRTRWQFKGFDAKISKGKPLSKKVTTILYIISICLLVLTIPLAYI